MVTYSMTQATKRTAEMVNEARCQALEDAADLAAIEEIKASGGPNWVYDEGQRLMDAVEAEADGVDLGR